MLGRINEVWHAAHPMPDRPTAEERVNWHFEHARLCGCRPVPESLVQAVKAMGSRHMGSGVTVRRTKGGP
jgi:hypothetical protein